MHLQEQLFGFQYRKRPRGGAAPAGDRAKSKGTQTRSQHLFLAECAEGGTSMVHKLVHGIVGALAFMACPFSVHAQAQGTDPGVKLAFMPRRMTVTLLNEGVNYVFVDMKHIPQGVTCRMDKDATIARVGPGASPETTRVRYAGAQVSAGGCPFLTTFDMANTDYEAARAAFLQMKDEASKKVVQIKKELGEKWDEVVGKKDYNAAAAN